MTEEDKKIEKLKEKILELEKRLFLIDMRDVWSISDKILYDKITLEIKQIKHEIEDIKNKQ